MNNCGCKRPAVGPEPHAPVPLHGGGFVPNAIEWLKEKIDRLFGTAVFTVNGHKPEGGNVDVIVPSKVSELENDAGYLTEHQDVSGIAATAEEALSVATDAAENSVRIVNGKTPTGGSVKIVLNDLADKDGNIETSKTIMVSRDGGESRVAVALYSDLISEIDTHNNDEAAHTKLMATVARIYATKTDVEKKYDKTGGPISGDVSISGSLSLTGSAPKITANQKDFSFPTESGKLARAEDYYTTAEVDNKITTFVAHYLTGKDSAGHFVPFATRAALDYAKQHHTEEAPQFFYAGEPFTPTKNDYCVVLEDETVEGKTARYSFVGEWPTGSWQYQYTINDTAFSEAQWAAINSGVTSAWMESTLSALQAEVDRAKAAEAQLTTKANELDSAKANKADIEKHVTNTNNPHAVTADQIGAVPVSVLANYYTSKQVDEAVSKRRDNLDLAVYGYGNASVTFPDGFSIVYYGYEEQRYSAPTGGKTVEFYGPISSTAVPQYNFWVPYEYKDVTDFDPDRQRVWCLFGDPGKSPPFALTFKNGSYYTIGQFDSENPTLTLSVGEATGGAPTMTRPFGATGDALAKLSQVNAATESLKKEIKDKADAANAALAGKLDKTAVVAPSASATVGQAADAKAVGEALNGKVDNKNGVIKSSLAVGELENQTIIEPGSINQAFLEDPLSGRVSIATIKLPLESGTFALTSDIDARLPYPLYAVPSTGLLKDRAINTTSLASVTVPDNFTDMLIRASVASSLSVTMPGAISTKYGDTFPGEAGEYLITITKTGAAEAYVRTIKLEVANA